MSINDPNDYSYKSSKMVLLKDLTAKLKGYLFAVCILKKWGVFKFTKKKIISKNKSIFVFFFLMD